MIDDFGDVLWVHTEYNGENSYTLLLFDTIWKTKKLPKIRQKLQREEPVYTDPGRFRIGKERAVNVWRYGLTRISFCLYFAADESPFEVLRILGEKSFALFMWFFHVICISVYLYCLL